MKVLELMQRAGMKETTLAIKWLEDAFHLIQSNNDETLKTVKYNIIDGERDYLLPSDMISISNISILDTSDNIYKQIRRLNKRPVESEDTDPD